MPQSDFSNDNISLNNLSKIGAMAKIKTVKNYENGIIKVTVTGISRAQINSLYMQEGVYYASLELKEDIQYNIYYMPYLFII